MIASLREKYRNEPNLSWNRDNDNFDILNCADLLISDFSGVIFDFAFVFNKPIIYADTSFDSSQYDAAWINDDLWTIKILPKFGFELKDIDFPKIKAKIKKSISGSVLEKCLFYLKRKFRISFY